MDNGRWLLLGVVALLLVLSTALILPYAQFVMAAVVVAFILRPLQCRLSPRLGETYAALALVSLSVAAILGPFFVVTALIANDVRRFLAGLQEFDPEPVETQIAGATGMEVDISGAIQSAVEGTEGTMFGGALTAVDVATHLLVGVALMLFLLFYLVRDGDALVAWFQDVTPIPESVGDDLVDRLQSLTKAVLVGHLLVAVAQGVVAGIGLAAVGIPNTIFWTFVMILVGLIPIVGTFVIWAPASVYLVTTGQTVAGAALFVYGLTVVAVTDEYLRPILVDRYAHINPAIILLGVIGGLTVFGFMGLFVGPIVIGALAETVEVYGEQYGNAAGSG